MSRPRAPRASPRGSYLRKREKTRARLLDAARRVMAGKGVEGTTIAEIAAAADVAPGTFYNYFQTREEILDAVAASLVDEFRRVMTAIERGVDDPAERIAIAIRLFLERVRDDSLWGWFMARYAPSLPVLRDQTRDIIRDRILADGLRRRRFRLPSTRAVGDLIAGTTVTALRSILEGRASVDVASEVAELVLRGLGVPLREAHAIANRPIPSLRAADASLRRMVGRRRRIVPTERSVTHAPRSRPPKPSRAPAPSDPSRSRGRARAAR